ncbi:nitroreductase family protein [Hydrogenophaga sp. BPS33]|uniref:nitroreductase family protein n=1 Tax=Hydrogenophaga sp. BPS33 TaxID=2651974 RepID=UPI00131FD089|nr:nitroreductase [Hydrogenophaga sp. BPS33]QHE87016.1 nitroreductase [Hydrogenophaga sp. BPS33]
MTQADTTDPLAGLLTRFSVGPKHLARPAPSLEALRRMAEAALRAPDHAGLVPFRFAAIRGDARSRLADLYEQAALLAGKDAQEAQRDRSRALDAPLLVAVIARIDPGHPVATEHEQWMAVGGALTNFMNAAHALGYAGKMLSGAKVRAAPVVAAFCGPGERLVGWVVLGTAGKSGAPKFKKPAPDEVLSDWMPPA